jgi:hypothetical protein
MGVLFLQLSTIIALLVGFFLEMERIRVTEKILTMTALSTVMMPVRLFHDLLQTMDVHWEGEMIVMVMG